MIVTFWGRWASTKRLFYSNKAHIDTNATFHRSDQARTKLGNLTHLLQRLYGSIEPPPRCFLILRTRAP